MKNSLRIHKWTHNEFNIFILGVLTHPLFSNYFQRNFLHFSIERRNFGEEQYNILKEEVKHGQRASFFTSHNF